MKKITTLITILLVSISIYGQNGGIKGKVVSSDNSVIPNANIMIRNSNNGTKTNSNGEFEISNIAPGNYTIKVSYVGYASQNMKVVVVENSVTNVPTIVLLESEEQLKEVVVEGHQNRYAEREPSQSLRLKTAIAKLPQNIQVINSDLLQDQQVTSIMDGVIRNVSGVTMLEHWGHFARINMRGFRLPAFRNGVNVQDTWGPLSEDMNSVDRIEFVKGPSGFMMSAGEPGGFYNVVTKKPTASKVAQISFAVGSFDNYRATADFGGKLTENGKLLYRINGVYQTADSHRGNEDAQKYNIAPSLTFNISDKTSITSELNFQHVESFIGAAYIFAPVADGYGSLDRNFKFTDTNYPATDIDELTFFTYLNHKLSENWDFDATFGYIRGEQIGNSAWASITDTGDASRAIYSWQSLSLGKFLQTYLSGNFNTGSISHTILGGFDYTEKRYYAGWDQFHNVDAVQPFNIYNPVYGNTEAPNFDYSRKIRDITNNEPYNGFTTRSFYAQDEIGFVEDKIRLTLAGRYTELITVGKTDHDDKFTPRVGLSVDILPSLAVYGMYDQSFLGQNGRAFDNSVIDPVDAIDIEGGLKKSFFDGRLKTSLGVYQITKQNVTTTDYEHAGEDGNFPFVLQIGEVQSKGIEFDMQGEITPELNIVLNYANTNVEVTNDSDETIIGNKVPGHAKHVTNGWLNYNFSDSSKLKGFGASIGYQYQVERSTWAWAADNQSDLPNYLRLDGGLSWNNDSLRIQVNVNNILNEYLYSGANYGTYLYWQSEPGINGRVTVTYNL